MKAFASIGIAKEVLRVCALDSRGAVLLNRKLLNTPEELNRLVAKLRSPCASVSPP